MLKKFKFGFEIWGLFLFLIIMIPNFIWFAVPAPNDILRKTSITSTIDTIASVCQVLMIIALCILKNTECKKLSFSPLIIDVFICCLLYCISWIFYYLGVINLIIILGLTVFPCLAFLFFAIDRKNIIAVIPISIFTACHLIYGIVNFVV